MSVSRRDFLKASGTAAGVLSINGLGIGRLLAQDDTQPPATAPPTDPAQPSKPLYKISLAQWSLNREIRSGEIDNLDFAGIAKSEFGIGAVEYVNQFFPDKAEDQEYLGQMKQRCEDNGVTSVLIMIDREGNIGEPDEAARHRTVDNHKKWVTAAKFLGCHSIRVNAGSRGTYEEQVELAADGLRKLTEFADGHEINVIVENHGGLSSNGAWLSEVMRKVDHPRCGTLPDFGNFVIDRGEVYDEYQGVTELMPFAKGVSAKTYEFDPERPLVTLRPQYNRELDFERLMKIVVDAGYRGYVGIEYEGRGLSAIEGIRRTQEMLITCRDKLSIG